MTNHTNLTMYKEERRVSDKEIISSLLSQTSVGVLALYDTPFPYVVPLNYGYEWTDQLVLWCHTAPVGHKLKLLGQDPHVAVSISTFLDRVGYQRYKGQRHDYRSVSVFGLAKVVTPDSEEEFLHGIGCLCRNTGRPVPRLMAEEWRSELVMLKITAEQITAKAQYPLSGPDEAAIPPLMPL